MSKQKKAIIITAVVIAAVAIAMAAVYFLTRPQTARGEKRFTVEIVHADGSKKTLNFSTDDEYLGEVLKTAGLLSDEKSASGLYILVDGEYAIYEENGAYWALYEGDDYAQQGIDETPVVDGGTYSLVYSLG